MRDLKRRNSNTLAIHELAKAGLEVFTPMTQMVMTIGGRRQRREVPVIQDLLFIHEFKEALDPFVATTSTLQYRFLPGHKQNEPMTVRDKEMDRFIQAVTSTETPVYYQPGELTPQCMARKCASSAACSMVTKGACCRSKACANAASSWNSPGLSQPQWKSNLTISKSSDNLGRYGFAG